MGLSVAFRMTFASLARKQAQPPKFDVLKPIFQRCQGARYGGALGASQPLEVRRALYL